MTIKPQLEKMMDKNPIYTPAKIIRNHNFSSVDIETLADGINALWEKLQLQQFHNENRSIINRIVLNSRIIILLLIVNMGILVFCEYQLFTLSSIKDNQK